MYSLSKDQVRLIESDVERARITLSHLSQELTDHICCEVEVLMSQKEKSFDEAYALIKEQAGIQVLQKIEENTRYLIDKKYAIMKTIMKITGNVSLALLGIGTVMRIFHLPAAGAVLIAGFVLLCLIFFPSAIYLNQQEERTSRQQILNLSILVGGITFMAGILFKVMHWPGSGLLLLIGWSVILCLFLPVLLFVKLREAATKREKRVYVLGVIALIIFEFSAMFKVFHWPGTAVLMLTGSVLLICFFLPMFTWIRFKESGKITGQFIFVIIISMYAIILTTLLSLRVSAPILTHFVTEESNSSKIARYFEEKRNLQKTTENGIPDSLRLKTANSMQDISEEANRLQSLIAGIKLDLVRRADQVEEQTALRAVSNPELIRTKDNINQVQELMIGMESGFAKTLKEELNLFRKKACNATSSDTALSGNIAMLLNTTEGNAETGTWEERNFSNNMLISTIALLTDIEKNVRLVESKTIRHIEQQNL